MRVPLRTRLLVVPLLVLVSTVLATALAAQHAAAAANARIAERQAAIARTLQGPPTFPLTLPVLQQMKSLTGAEFSAGGISSSPFDASQFIESKVELAPPHPNAGQVVSVYFPESVRRAEVNEAVQPVVILGSVAGLLGMAFSLVTSRWLVKRIHALEAGTRSIAAGDFRSAVSAGGNDELGDLAASVNDMARKLAENVDVLKHTERWSVLGQIAGGLAHQLRNATAGARLAMQLAEKDRQDPEPLTVAQRQLTKLETILNQFLELGRPEPRALKTIDLNAFLSKTVASFQSAATHQQIALSIQSSTTEGISKPLDERQFAFLMENLIQNALDAAGPNGNVVVRLTPNGIDVIDNGPGPPVGVRLFEPFATTKPGGIGLGLVVAKRVAEAHGMSLNWSRQGDTTVFALRFVSAMPNRCGDKAGS